LKEDDVNKKPVLMCFILALAPVMEPSARLIRASPAVFSQSSEQPSATYTITDLGALGAFDINAVGQVVGHALTTNNTYHAFLWQNGVMTDLGTMEGATHSLASAINDSGQVVGFSYTHAENGSWPTHAFLWQNGVMTDLGTLGGTFTAAWDINAVGQVVGYAPTTDGWTHAFLWQDGLMTDLGDFGTQDGASYSSASAINASGQVAGWAQWVGWAETGEGGGEGEVVYAIHAFLWQNGVMTDLGQGQNDSLAYAINASGQVVGWDRGHAFLWQNGTMSNLGTLGGNGSLAFAINTLGQVVGKAQTIGDTDDHAFLWQNGVMTDLNTLVPPGSGWVLLEARAINDSGQIVGRGWFNNQARAFLLTPLAPETVAFTVEPQTFAAGEIHHTQQFIHPTFTALVHEPGPPACQIEQDAGRQQSQRPGLGRVVHHHRKPLECGLCDVVSLAVRLHGRTT
jgi:probable HAF family extracellular repeat protein